MTPGDDIAGMPTVLERTPAGGIVVLHTAPGETPVQTAALLIELAFGGIVAEIAREIRGGTFEPRTAQGVVYLLREEFARIEPSLRDRMTTTDIDTACLEAVRDRRTALDQLEQKHQEIC